MDGRRSPSSRRAWVEIASALSSKQQKYVALLAEGVGRNINCGNSRCGAIGRVALLAEGVGRNITNNYGDIAAYLTVALLAEGVGRNNLDSAPLGVR